MTARGLTLVAALAAGALTCKGDDDGRERFDRLVQGCIASSACGVRRYARVSDCVDAYHDLYRRFGLGPIYDGIYACVAAARGSCDAIHACWGSSRSGPSCDTSFKARCDGNRAVSCDTLAGKTFALDCGGAGLTCRTRNPNTIDADCTTGGCATGTPPRCDGNRVLSCKVDGNLEIDDCGAAGLVCGQGSGGSADCVGATGADCAGSQRTCEGNVAVTCEGGKLGRTDCGGLFHRTTCASGKCEPAGGACRDQFNRCQGTSLEYCLDGEWRTLDCAGAGLGPCAGGASGADCTAAN